MANLSQTISANNVCNSSAFVAYPITLNLNASQKSMAKTMFNEWPMFKREMISSHESISLLLSLIRNALEYHKNDTVYHTVVISDAIRELNDYLSLFESMSFSLGLGFKALHELANKLEE